VSADASNPAIPAPGVRSRLLRGSAFEIAGFGAQQVLRFGSSYFLAQLLFPAAFGLSTLVSVIMQGLAMLSDVAISPCVIQSKRGDDPAFLNTAFTIQAIRGAVLGTLMVALARPASWFYHEPGLEPLIYIGSAQLFLGGLHSTSVFTLRRHLTVGWINVLELGQTALTVTLGISLARHYPSAWVLVAATTCSGLVYALATHFLPVGYRNRFHWDKEAAAEIGRFGRWVLGSSAATFLGGQSDRIVLGRFLGAAWLGIYGIATNLSEAISSLVMRLINGVVYPALSHHSREGKEIGGLYYRLRLRLDAAAMPALGTLAGLAPWIVSFIYDERYQSAGWILRILCVRVALTFIIAPNEAMLFTLGHTRYGFMRSVTRLVATLVFIPVGWYLAGVQGVIWATVAAEGATLFAVWPKSRSLGVLRVRRELLSLFFFGAAFLLAAALCGVLPRVHLPRLHHHAP
jgi:O-antigen/teichoic acid export membrane protein